MIGYEKNTKKNWEEVVKTSGGTPSFWQWYEQCEFFWGCIPKVAGMLAVMDNGIQVPYIWQTIDLEEEYEQYWPKEQDPIFDLNKDCDVVSLRRRVIMGLIQPFKPKKWWLKLLDLNPLVKKFAKILSVERKPSGICKRKRPNTHLSLLHKQWTDLWTQYCQMVAWGRLIYKWFGTTLHLPNKCI